MIRNRYGSMATALMRQRMPQAQPSTGMFGAGMPNSPYSATMYQPAHNQGFSGYGQNPSLTTPAQPHAPVSPEMPGQPQGTSVTPPFQYGAPSPGTTPDFTQPVQPQGTSAWSNKGFTRAVQPASGVTRFGNQPDFTTNA